MTAHSVRITFADGWGFRASMRTYPAEVSDPSKQAEADAKAMTEMLERFKSWGIASYRDAAVRASGVVPPDEGIHWNMAMEAAAVPEIVELRITDGDLAPEVTTQTDTGGHPLPELMP